MRPEADSARTWVSNDGGVAGRVWSDDRGLLLGDGLFETLLVHNGRPFRLSQHLERMEGGLKRLGVAFPESDIAEGVGAMLLDDIGDGEFALRVTVTRGRGPRGLSTRDGEDPTVIVSLSPLAPGPEAYETGVSAGLNQGVWNERAASVGLKTLGYLDAIIEQDRVESAGFDEGIWVNTAGDLVGGNAGNLFVVLPSGIRTPPLGTGALPGITRGLVVELAHRAGIGVDDRSRFGPALLPEATEMFLTNSLRRLVPIVQVEGEAVGRGDPGEVWRSLYAAYNRLVELECPSEV